MNTFEFLYLCVCLSTCGCTLKSIFLSSKRVCYFNDIVCFFKPGKAVRMSPLLLELLATAHITQACSWWGLWNKDLHLCNLLTQVHRTTSRSTWRWSTRSFRPTSVYSVKSSLGRPGNSCVCSSGVQEASQPNWIESKTYFDTPIQ